jgi:hypothetical protein
MAEVQGVHPNGHVISSQHAGWVDLPCTLSLYFNTMPRPSHHVKLALNAGVKAIIATSRKPMPCVSYLESYLNELQWWLCVWRITINVSKSTAIIFVWAGWCFIQPQPVTLFREPIRWVDTICYLGVTLDTLLTWSPLVDEVRKKTAQRMGMLGPLLNRSDLSIRNRVLLYKQLIHLMMDYACPAWRKLPTHTSRDCRCCNPSVFALLRVPLGTLVAGRFTRIWVFHNLLTTSEP